MARAFSKIPIVDAARRCGLVLDSRTLRRDEVEASCPFCGDHGPGKYHLSLNTVTDQYRCNLCGASGNSVSLYARVHGVSNKEAYLELAKDGKVYPMPSQPDPQTQERRPRALEERHAVITDYGLLRRKDNGQLPVFQEPSQEPQETYGPQMEGM